MTREFNLIPIVMTAAMWGRFWEAQVVHCRCDNETVVTVLTSRTSKDLLRVVILHISGVENVIVDHL